MQALVVFSALYFLSAVILGGAALNEGSLVLFSLAVAGALAGVLLLAADRALIRLTEIRDAIQRGPVSSDLPTGSETKAASPEKSEPYKVEAGSLADLDRKLAVIRDRIQG
jgi:hypothetical protein